MTLKKNKLLIGVFMCTAVAAVFVVTVFIGAFAKLQFTFSDWLYLSSPKTPSKDIIIVGVDEKTLAALGDTGSWSRSVYAQALDNLNKYDPSVVVFDVFFRSPRDENGDNKFLDALTNTKNIIIAFRNELTDENGNTNRSMILPQDTFRSAPHIELGFDTSTHNDEVFRNYLLSYQDSDGNIFKSLALQSANLYLQFINKPEIIFNKNDQILNYFSKPTVDAKAQSHYATVSFLDLYNDSYTAFNPNYFKDKITLIGGYSTNFKDSFFVPFSKDTKMYGVEIHANAIQSILENKFLREMSTMGKIVLIVILAVLSTFLFLYTKVRWSLLYLFGVPLVYTLLAPWAFNYLNLIFDMVHPYLVILSSFAVVYIYRYVTEFKEKLALKGAFSKYVNPEIVKQITEHPENLHLGGTKLPITVLFTDIAHFTTISENLTPESLVALLNEYFDAMSEVILAQGGTLDKFEGDAIMAFFGAPIHYPDHALRAANAAIGMRHKLNELLKKWANDAPLPGGEKKPVIDFRCGLSSGDVIVGNVGSKERFEYTVMGDIVNLGSRLEGANKKYSTNTMVSEATYLLIKDSFEGRELDTIRVVGKNKPIKVYEILSHKGELPADAMSLLQSYNEGIALYHARKYGEGLEKFKQILQKFPADGPSKMYVQRCEVLRDFPRPADWDEVFEMGSK